MADITELRTLLRKNAVEYKVVKNTLAKLAVKETDLAGLAAYLEGPTAVALSRTDPVAASKAVTAWAKGRPTFVIKGGIVEGRVLGRRRSALADLPSRRGEVFGPRRGRCSRRRCRGCCRSSRPRCGDWPAFSTRSENKKGGGVAAGVPHPRGEGASVS